MLCIIIIIIIIIKRPAIKGWEKAINARSVCEETSPTLPTHIKKEEKGKTVEDNKWSEQLDK